MVWGGSSCVVGGSVTRSRWIGYAVFEAMRGYFVAVGQHFGAGGNHHRWGGGWCGSGGALGVVCL